MTKTKDKQAADDAKKRVERELEGGTAGALAGATIGAIGGAPGAIAGAIVGAIAGAVTGRAVEKADEARAAGDRELDGEIGVSGGGLGAPNLEYPPPKIGASRADHQASARRARTRSPRKDRSSPRSDAPISPRRVPSPRPRLPQDEPW